MVNQSQNLRGVAYLRKKLDTKRRRVLTRYKYYEMKNAVLDFGISSPPELKDWRACLGWPAKAVDTLADRLVFREFRQDNFDLNGIFQLNNPDTFFPSSVLSALIASCCFVYISPDSDGFPRLQVLDGGEATGVIDPITGLLQEGYAVLDRNDYGAANGSLAGSIKLDAYFEPFKTTYYDGAGKVLAVTKHNVPYPLLVPIINRPDAHRPFGHSRISRACMSIVGSAIRTVKRSEISAEFFSFPQKYVTGISEEADIKLDRWAAAMSSLFTITRGEESDEKPTVGQFAQQSMAPHTDQMRMWASLFSGETGLTLDDLGFPSDNPSASEAIKAAHETLRLTAARATRDFGSGFLNVGFLAACLRDNRPYLREQLYLTTPIWEPVFEPDAAALSSIGDGAMKINQAVPGYFDAERLRDITGIKPGGTV
nr:hypothetical protein [uncultured Dysosmobacter sp.]